MSGGSLRRDIQTGFTAASILTCLLPQTSFRTETTGKYLRYIVKAGAGFGPCNPWNRAVLTSRSNSWKSAITLVWILAEAPRA